MRFLFLIFLFFDNYIFATQEGTRESKDVEQSDEDKGNSTQPYGEALRFRNLSRSELIHVLSSSSIEEGLRTLDGRTPSIVQKERGPNVKNDGAGH